jgi:hypothetical protein
MIAGASPARTALAVAGALLLLATGALCVRMAASGAYAEDQPARALRWDPRHPGALAALAENVANSAEDDASLERAARLARRALLLNPLEFSALRTLALDAERQGDEAGALRLMTEVSRRTRRDSLAQAWMMDREFKAGRYEAGFAYGDAILRRAPEWSDAVHPMMTATFADPASRPALLELLASGPEWRRAYLAELTADAQDLEGLRAFFVAFRKAKSPLTDQEIGLVLGRLIAEGRFLEARTVWGELSGRPAREAALVYDGDFRGAPGAAPFNWGLASDASAIAERVAAPDGSPALYVRFPASEATPLAEQLLVLEPGDYVLTGRVTYGERPPERLSWRLQCADGPTIPLDVQYEPERAGGWRRLQAAFNVPAQDCPGQWLQLGSQAEEDFGMVEAWYGDIAVTPRG